MTTMTADLLLQIHPSDTVAIAVEDLPAGQSVRLLNDEFSLLDHVPKGHKVALRDIPSGESVLKYGYPIGHAISAIRKGDWVHGHNLRTNLSGKLSYQYKGFPTNSTPCNRVDLPGHFDGYIRANGDVGIRNEIWIINTVGCINKTAERLATLAAKKFAQRGIDDVCYFPHPYGCSQLGDDLQYTQAALAGLAKHPNAAGVLVIGLGCENNQLQTFLPMVGETDPNRLKYMAVQAVDDEFEEGLDLLEQLVDHAETFHRTLVPLSKLRVGLKCGGSDAFSGVTANPLVGRFSNLLVASGGTSLLSEVPEMFGAETLLMDRSENEETFDKIVHLINDFKDYYTRHNQVIYENPSPGNKDGGITTLEEKSLGCVQKGGDSLVSDVLQYGESAVHPGLQLVQSPGNDMVSVTAMIASGAHLVLFTTGRGTPMGGAVPTLKIATNTELATRKPHWIDFDAGRLLHGEDMDDVAVSLFLKVIAIASGEQTRNEENDFREIAIFKDGVTL